MLVNTQEFTKPAEFFRKNGKYDCGVRGSIHYKAYWERERGRCLYGYKVGDLYVTGHHYYYLNYCPIEQVEKTFGSVHTTRNKSAKRKVDFPAFWDVDYVFFMCCHIARWGVGILDPLGQGDFDRGFKAYKKLPISLGLVETEENLSGGKHLLWLKPRGVGASYKGGSMASRNFHLIPTMKSFMFADDKEYLIKDGLFTKFINYKSFLDLNTEFKVTSRKKSSLSTMHFVGSYDDDYGNLRGTLSEMIGVSFKNDPEKARGKRGILALWEEFGKFPNAEIAWNICRKSFEEGGLTYGLMLGFGTGGSEGNDFFAMQTMSTTPEAYNLLAFNNLWDAGMEGTKFSLFTPAYYNIQFRDKDGNSNTKEAKAQYESERLEAEKSPDPAHIERVKAESPFTPQEAMLNTVNNLFMVKGFGDWINRVNADTKIRDLGVPKKLTRVDSGEIIAEINTEHPPIIKYPHSGKDSIHGSVVEWAVPYNDASGRPPEGLYIIGHDPFAEDDVEDVTSLGASYVYMNPNNIVDGDKGDRIVASWIGRPTTMDEYNKILFLLSERWNAKIGFENDRGDVLGYAKRLEKERVGFKIEDFLAGEFDLAWDEKISGKRKSTYKYGMRMGSGKTNVRLLLGNRYIADWLVEGRGVTEKGKLTFNYNYLLDAGLLNEMKLYNGVRNADRISALRLVMYHAKELAYNGNKLNKKRISGRKSSKHRFFQGDY